MISISAKFVTVLFKNEKAKKCQLLHSLRSHGLGEHGYKQIYHSCPHLNIAESVFPQVGTRHRLVSLIQITDDFTPVEVEENIIPHKNVNVGLHWPLYSGQTFAEPRLRLEGSWRCVAVVYHECREVRDSASYEGMHWLPGALSLGIPFSWH